MDREIYTVVLVDEDGVCVCAAGIDGVSKEDAEAAGFDEGDKPVNWIHSLENRGIRAQADVLREEAAAVLKKYAKTEGAIYHPGQQ